MQGAGLRKLGLKEDLKPVGAGPESVKEKEVMKQERQGGGRSKSVWGRVGNGAPRKTTNQRSEK